MADKLKEGRRIRGSAIQPDRSPQARDRRDPACERATTAGRTEALAATAGRIPEDGPGGPARAITALARMLIEYTYDVIERSRRRGIFEAVSLARHAADDDEVRRRILDYLQEGLGAQYIDDLLQMETVDLNAWLGLAAKARTRMDAGELRGLCIRALESQPDHPGLLLTRATAEAMCSDHDHVVSREGIETGLGMALFKYELPEAEILSGVNGLFDMAEGQLHARAQDGTDDPDPRGAENTPDPGDFRELVGGLGPVLTMGVLDFAEEVAEGAFLKPAALERGAGLRDPETNVVLAAHHARNAVNRVHAAVRRITEGW